MLRRALQFQRQGQKRFPPQFWKQQNLTAISVGPDLRMAAEAVDPEHKHTPDMTLLQLAAACRFSAPTLPRLLVQGLLQTSQSSSSLRLPSILNEEYPRFVDE